MSTVHLCVAPVSRVLAQAGLDAQAGPPAWFSAAEVRRWAGLTGPRRRQQFLAGRWALRQLLAERCGGRPTDFLLTAPIDAAPQLQAPASVDLDDTSSTHLALSHSGGWVACAVAQVPIGLDVEAPLRERALAALLPEVASAPERLLFEALPAAQWPARFYALWTLKEAWLKRAGTGIVGDVLQGLDTVACDACAIHTPASANAWLWQPMLAPHDASTTPVPLTVALVAPANALLRWVGSVVLGPAQRWQVRPIDTGAGAGR